MTDDLLTLAADLVARAKRHGASDADAIAIDRRTIDVAIRDGATERLEQAEGREVGLRVFVGQSSAIISGSKLDAASLERMAERAVTMARAAPPDPFVGLASVDQLSTEFPDLDLVANSLPDGDRLRAHATETEAAALGVHGVSKSGGADASASERHHAIVASNGFSGSYSRTMTSFSVSAIAGEGTGMERDYDYSAAVHAEDLKSAESIGQSAGTRAVRRLKPRKVESQAVPVIFDRRVASSLAGHLVAAAMGPAIARKTSFLRDKLGQQIFPSSISIIDDPFRPRGLASRPFDAEGLNGARRAIIDQGILTGWFLDLHAARQLGLSPTGNASRGLSGPPGPSPSNLHVAPGAVTPAQLMGDINRGLYVTELIGSGANIVTGDYSRGASGFWIENGELTFPVSEITIAGDLPTIFANLAAANDLEFKSSSNAPTCRVEGLTIAGA
ncbi:MAG: TldD/PmbA family protein [Hyphomicrobiales bacterium]